MEFVRGIVVQGITENTDKPTVPIVKIIILQMFMRAVSSFSVTASFWFWLMLVEFSFPSFRLVPSVSFRLLTEIELRYIYQDQTGDCLHCFDDT